MASTLDDNSFIIKSKYQSVFCVDRDWTLNLLYNYQKLYQLSWLKPTKTIFLSTPYYELYCNYKSNPSYLLIYHTVYMFGLFFLLISILLPFQSKKKKKKKKIEPTCHWSIYNRQSASLKNKKVWFFFFFF